MRSLARWLTLAALASAPQSHGSDKLQVLTSFLPAYCFAVHVAGDFAQVQNLSPGAVGPHEFQLAPRDMRKLARADLIIVNGLNLESRLERSIQASGWRSKLVHLSGGLEEQLIYDPANPESPLAFANEQRVRREGLSNPHIWLDPQLAAHSVTNIMIAMQKADPSHAEAYHRNALRYVHVLNKLDSEIQTGLRALKQRKVVTHHNAFPYFLRRYHLELLGVIEPVPDLPPGIKYLSRLEQNIRSHQIKVIFTEPQFSSRLARQIARRLDLALAQLDTLETGPPRARAYEIGMRRNLAALKKYLE